MSRVTEITTLELDEHQEAVYLDEQLERALQFLHRHRADADLIDAVWTAIENNRQWINKDLLVDGSA
jgi:hypothetical protein